MPSQGEAWYRSRIQTGHSDWVIIGRTRLPVLPDEDCVPLRHDLLDRVPDPDDMETEVLNRVYAVTLLRPLLDALYSRERWVIEHRYSDNRTLDDIGRSLGVTRERVRQIQYAAENRLCDRLGIPRIHD